MTPERALCLIDDAGFGQTDTFVGLYPPRTSPGSKKWGSPTAAYVTAVCSPTRAALVTCRNNHRVGFGSIAEYPAPFPGYTASRPRTCTALPRTLTEYGLRHRWVRKMAPHGGQRRGPAGPFDHWPQSWDFNHWWGFLSGAARPVRPDHHPGQLDPRRASGERRQALLLP